MRQAPSHKRHTSRRGKKVARLALATFTATSNYAVVYNRGDGMMAAHAHDDFDELVFTVKGSGIHVADGDEYPLVRGDVFVLRGAHMHGFKFRRELSLMNILYRRTRFTELMSEFAGLRGFHELFVHEHVSGRQPRFTSRLRLDTRQMDTVASSIHAMQEELDHPRPGSEIIVESLFKILVVQVCQFYSRAEHMSARAGARIGAAISFIERNFAGQVTIPALIRATRMPRSTLLRVFKEVTGCSPINYLISLRITRATEMLASQDLRIIDAALRCGFENIGYFNRKFKAIMGITPKQYVKTHRAPLV